MDKKEALKKIHEYVVNNLHIEEDKIHDYSSGCSVPIKEFDCTLCIDLDWFNSNHEPFFNQNGDKIVKLEIKCYVNYALHGGTCSAEVCLNRLRGYTTVAEYAFELERLFDNQEICEVLKTAKELEEELIVSNKKLLDVKLMDIVEKYGKGLRVGKTVFFEDIEYSQRNKDNQSKTVKIEGSNEVEVKGKKYEIRVAPYQGVGKLTRMQ